jgi:hypothetical protein
MERRRLFVCALVACGFLLLASCAAGPNASAEADAGAAGFWLGLWQGFITPVTFVISLFTDNVNIYEVDNSGNWYDFGFVIGLAMIWGSGSRAKSASRR